MDMIYKHFVEGFQRTKESSTPSQRRIGVELKFPFVNSDGRAVEFKTVCALWDYLEECGWQSVKDEMNSHVIGAKKAGKLNDTVASCETGFCKTEFSLAHTGDLFELDKAICKLREELRPFSKEHDVLFLGYGIQPVTLPSKRLMMKKSRTSVWDKVFSSNRHIPRKDGDDVHLFTINASSHVHVSVSKDEAIPAVNVLNGFAGAQIALGAHSNVWRGQIDPQYKCVAEKFWDWWMPNSNRTGIPHKPFRDIRDYVCTIAAFRPVYVKRVGKPIVLTRYQTFEEYYRTARAVGIDTEGREISFVPQKADIDLHNTCYWWDARISQYSTVENRVNDQQPPDDLVCVPALTLGLMSALHEASEELSCYRWEDLRAAREAACREALSGNNIGQINLAVLAKKVLELAEFGLRQRGIGEEKFLYPLKKRLHKQECPADEVARLFAKDGIDGLLNARKL